ncbi:MAG TPA: hypothetical protein VJ725_32525 [Thermoanaerobaculia bacterium]|nr:hypothetical protein [Thermoanaerobaculia bacterium]
MYIWRLPLINFAALLAFIAVVAWWEILAFYRQRCDREVLRGVLFGAGITAALLSPLLVHAIVAPELRYLAARGVDGRSSWIFYAAPPLAAATLFHGSRRLIRPLDPHRDRTVAVFWSTIVTFTLLNLANWCNPGWCAHFGFPFRYLWWSDAIVIMNGVSLSAGTSLLALLANVACAVAVTILAVHLAGRAWKPRAQTRV